MLLALAGCSGDEADIPTIERRVANGIESQTQARGVTVECPAQMEWEAGRDFHCFAEDRSGNRTRVTVHMENGEGSWSWVIG